MTIPHHYLSGGGVTGISVAVTVAAGERLRVYVACGNNSVTGSVPDLPSSVLWGAIEPQLLTAESGGAVAAGANGKLHSYALDAPAAGTYNVTATWDGEVDEAAIVARVFPSEGDITRITNSGSASPASVAAAIAEGNLLAGVLYIATDNGDLDNIEEVLDEYDEEEEASKVDAFVDPGDTEGYMAVVGMSFEGVASETKSLAATFSGTGDTGWAGIAHKLSATVAPDLTDPGAIDVGAKTWKPRGKIAGSISPGEAVCVIVKPVTDWDTITPAQVLAGKDKDDNDAMVIRRFNVTAPGDLEFEAVNNALAGMSYGQAIAYPGIDKVITHLVTTTESEDPEDYQPVIAFAGDVQRGFIPHDQEEVGGNAVTWWWWAMPFLSLPTNGCDVHATIVEFLDKPSAAQIALGHGSNNEPYYINSPDGPQHHHVSLFAVPETGPLRKTQVIPHINPFVTYTDLIGGWDLEMSPIAAETYFTIALAAIYEDRATVYYMHIRSSHRT